jgi:hypothetical protein
VQEIKSLRDALAHPKVKQGEMFNIYEDKHGNFVGSVDDRITEYLKINKTSSVWGSSESKSVINAVIGFYNYYFIELLEFHPDQTFEVLASPLELGEVTEFSIMPEYHPWIVKIREWGMSCDFIESISEA